VSEKSRFTGTLVAVVIVLIGLKALLPESQAEKVARAERQAQIESQSKQDAAQKDADRALGKHCQGVGGESYSFSKVVQSRLRNPKSFEHVATSFGPLDHGAHAVSMTYRATNGFGAVDTAVAIGEVRNADCAAKVVSM